MSSELESVSLPAELLEEARDVADPLDTARAQAAGVVLEQGGEPRGDIVAAHVIHCAQRRGWPVITSDPEPLLTLDSSIEIENLA